MDTAQNPVELQEQKIANNILAKLLSNDRIEDVIGQVLQDLGGLVSAKRVRLFTLNADKTILENKYEWAAPGVVSLHDNWKTMGVASLPWLMRKLWASEMVVVDAVETLPPEAVTEQDTLRRQNIGHMIALPLPVGRALGGFIELDEITDQARWRNGEQLRLLTMIIEGIGQKYGVKKTSTGTDKPADFYKLIFETVELGVLVISRQGIIDEVNRKLEEILGKHREYFIGKNLLEIGDLFPPGSVNVIARNLGMKRMGMAVPSFDVPMRAGDVHKHIEVNSMVLVSDGKPVGDLVMFRDITARKDSEEMVQENERRIRTILEAVKEGITLSDEKGQFIIFNPEMTILTGYTKQEANESGDFTTLIHPEFSERSKTIEILDQLKVGDWRTGESRIRAKDGQIKDVLVSTTVINQAGKKLFLSAFRDVTSRKKSEMEILTRNQELERITQQLNQLTTELQQARDNLEEKVKEKTRELEAKVSEVEDVAKFPGEDPSPVLRVAIDGKLLYANDASRLVLAWWHVGVGGVVPAEWQQIIGSALKEQEDKLVDLMVGEKIYACLVAPIHTGNYANIYARDVTREREVDKMKSEFISLASHQLRTPLTGLRWVSEKMLRKYKEGLDSKQLESIKTFYDTSVQLTRLVDDLLSWSRIETGRMPLNKVKTLLTTVAFQAVEQVKMLAEAKQITLATEFAVVPDFEFDPEMIKQVMVNLLSNAIKYTKDQGKVLIKIRPPISREVIVEVADNGIGVPKAEQSKLFERFYRASNATSSGLEGTGLGLSLVKMIVEKSGGRVWFESEEGKGSRFFFGLPVS